MQRYLIAKGSVAVNGVSLTVAQARSDGFRVAVIPLTYAQTNLHHLQPGDPVNLEADLLGKYVEKFLQGAAVVPAISQDFLSQHGFLGAGVNLIE